MWGRRVVFESVCCSSSAIDCVGSQCCSRGPIVERVTAATGTVNVFSLLAAQIFALKRKEMDGGRMLLCGYSTTSTAGVIKRYDYRPSYR